MNPEIIYWQNQVNHYRAMARFCEDMAKTQDNQFFWEEKLFHCESEKLRAEKMIGLIDIKNILKQAV